MIRQSGMSFEEIHFKDFLGRVGLRSCLQSDLDIFSKGLKPFKREIDRKTDKPRVFLAGLKKQLPQSIV